MCVCVCVCVCVFVSSVVPGKLFRFEVEYTEHLDRESEAGIWFIGFFDQG